MLSKYKKRDVIIELKGKEQCISGSKEAGLSDWIDFANALWKSPFEVDDEEEYSHT